MATSDRTQLPVAAPAAPRASLTGFVRAGTQWYRAHVQVGAGSIALGPERAGDGVSVEHAADFLVIRTEECARDGRRGAS